VANGDLEYQHFGAATIKTNVNVDGTFSGSGFNRAVTAAQNMNGKISGATMEANTQNPNCTYYLSLTKE
jgi:hypothetical protein